MDTGEVFGIDLTQASHPFGTMLNIYQEKTYDTKDAFKGEHLVGYAKYKPGPFDVTGEPLDDEKNGFDMRMITDHENT